MILTNTYTHFQHSGLHWKYPVTSLSLDWKQSTLKNIEFPIADKCRAWDLFVLPIGPRIRTGIQLSIKSL